MLGTLKKIYNFAGERQPLLKKSLVFAIINGLFAALQFGALLLVVDALANDTRNMNDLWICLVIMVVSVGGQVLVSYFSMLDQTVVGYGMVSDRRISIGDRLRYIPMGYFNKNNLGTLTGIVTTTLTDVENSAPIVLVSMIGGFFNAVMLVICLLIFNWQLGVTALIGAILYLLTTETATRKSTKSAAKRQEVQRNLVESILEYIQGLSVIKSFGFEKDSTGSVSSVIRNSNTLNTKLVNSVAPFIALQQIIIRIFSVIMMLISLYLFTTDAVSLAFGILLVILSFIIFNSLESAGSMITMLQMLAASIDTANLVNETPLMDENGQEQSPVNQDIVFDDVDFSYSSRKILDHINLTIPQKTTTAIIGPSGSGKTTLCNLIARFWDVNRGKITISGIDVRDYTLDSLMKNISMVFQNVYLFQDTIENNIKFGCQNATHDEVVEAAKNACCHDFIMSLPDGYDTVVGEGGGTLSGGEKQRISIARAMLKDAPIIILDESTSSVDPENENLLQEAIEKLTHDKTIIMIAHRLKTVRHADQIVVLNDAHIVQKGTHEELIKEDGLYKEFVEMKQQANGWRI